RPAAPTPPRSPRPPRSASTGNPGRCLAGDRVTLGAEQLSQRQPGSLGLEVPQRDVDGRDRLRGEPAAPHRGARPDELGPDPLDVARVLAEEFGSDLPGVGVQAGAAGPLGVAVADTLVAGLGAD